MIRETSFNYSLHYLRGIAILAIMFSHVWLFAGNTKSFQHKIYFALVQALFDGSTIYFIFISGFLLHHLKERFNTLKFYLSKLKYIISPYVFLSICILFLLSFFGKNQDSVDVFLSNIPNHLIKGTATGPYWYIPFIIPIFLIAPLLLNISEKQYGKAMPLLFLIPLLGTRSGVTITWYMYLYFFPIYLIGIYTSMNFNKVLAISKKYSNVILLAFISLCLVTFTLFLFEKKISFSIFSLTHSIAYLKSLFAIMLGINFCNRIKNKNIKSLNLLANYSFALYFVHDFINYRVFFISHKICDYFNFSSSIRIVWGFAWGVVVILTSLFVCIVAKRIIGKNSRFFIGV